MIYAYDCTHCNHAFDVIKPARDYDRKEQCDRCGNEATRRFVPSAVYFNGTKVEHAEYNPGLGCVVRNSQHRKELCKAKGLEEIGNEKVETVHKYFDKAREEKIEKAYEDVTKGWVGDGS